MALAIVLRLDAMTAGFIDAITCNLPDRQHSDPRRSYPPHLKLVVFDDTVNIASVDAVLAAIVGSWKALPIRLVGLGTFPSGRSVLWLLPTASSELLALHATLHRSLADIPSHPHYQIGAWVPHVSVARTCCLGDSVEVLATTWDGPILGCLDAVDLVQFDPVRVLSRRPLRG